MDEQATNATPLSDPNLSHLRATKKAGEKLGHVDVTEIDSSSELSLEEALDAAVRNASVGDSTPPPAKVSEEDEPDSSESQGPPPTAGDDSERKKEEGKLPEVKSGKEKQRSSKLRLVLKPLPDGDESEGDRAKREGCCDRCGKCTRGKPDSKEKVASLSSDVAERCSSHESLYSRDESSSCTDSSENQVPLLSSPGMLCVYLYVVRGSQEVHNMSKIVSST